MRSWWIWLLVPVLAVGAWFGWQHAQSLSYQATAHEQFVDTFQNGVRGAYSAAEIARHRLAEGNPALAARELTGAYYYLRMMQMGTTGMAIRLGPDLMPLEVTASYLNETTALADQLLTGSISPDIAQRLDTLSHDLTLLLELFGDEEQRQWLKDATAGEFSDRYQSWREQALIAPVVPPAEGETAAHHAAAEAQSDVLADRAVGLNSDQVLLRSRFGGGLVADRTFIGGQAILWQPEPHRYSVIAALHLGDGGWESASNLTTIAVAPEGPFHALAVLNPPWDRDKGVVIQALYGRVTDRQADYLLVELADGEILEAEVRQGLWLVAVTSPSQIQLEGARLRLFDSSGSLLREGLLGDERVG